MSKPMVFDMPASFVRSIAIAEATRMHTATRPTADPPILSAVRMLSRSPMRIIPSRRILLIPNFTPVSMMGGSLVAFLSIRPKTTESSTGLNGLRPLPMTFPITVETAFAARVNAAASRKPGTIRIDSVPTLILAILSNDSRMFIAASFPVIDDSAP